LVSSEESFGLGLTLSLLASVLWGVSPLLVDKIPWPSYIVSLARNLAALFLASAVLIIKGSRLDLDTWELLTLVLLGLLGPGLGDALFIASMKRIGAGLANVASYTYVFWASAMASLTEIDSITVGDLVGASTALVGLFIAFRDPSRSAELDRVDRLLGIASGLGAGVLWGGATLLSRILIDNMDPISIVAFRSASAAAFLTMISAAYGTLGRRYWRETPYLLRSQISGLMSYMGGYTLFLMSLPLAGVVIPSTISILSPIITLIFSMKWRREGISRRTLLGAGVVTAGLMISAISRGGGLLETRICCSP
jgi:DME family drug/metabolite transporter